MKLVEIVWKGSLTGFRGKQGVCAIWKPVIIEDLKVCINYFNFDRAVQFSKKKMKFWKEIAQSNNILEKLQLLGLN